MRILYAAIIGCFIPALGFGSADLPELIIEPVEVSRPTEAHLQAEVARLTSVAADMAANLSDSQRKLDSAQAQVVSAQDAAKSLSRQLSDCQELTKSLPQLSTELATARETHAALEAALAAEKSRQVDVDAQLSSQKAQIAELSTQLSELRALVPFLTDLKRFDSSPEAVIASVGRVRYLVSGQNLTFRTVGQDQRQKAFQKVGTVLVSVQELGAGENLRTYFTIPKSAVKN